MDATDIVLRLGVAAVLGGGLGLNRFLHRKSAGVRTLGLVSIVAASIVTGATDRLDPASVSRIIQGILTGIGFIGAGVIVRGQGHKAVHGLTTAATVWVAAACGILCGLGVWLVTAIGYGLAVALLTLGGPLEKWAADRYGISEGTPPTTMPERTDK